MRGQKKGAHEKIRAVRTERGEERRNRGDRRRKGGGEEIN